MKISIKHSNGKVTSKSFQMPVITIGRSNNNDFVISDESLSRHHCQIEHTNGEFYITDLGSANGVYLEDKRIPPHQRVKFDTFLQLSIGTFECTVIDDEASSFIKYTPPPKVTAHDLPEVRSQVTKINKPLVAATKKSSRPESAKKEEKTPLKTQILISIACLVCISGYIYLNNQEERAQIPTNLNKNIPENFRDVKDEFLTPEQYLDLDIEKSCQFSELCNFFGIKDEKLEGINKSSKEVFIFLNPTRFLEDPQYEKIKDSPEFNEIVAIHLLLKSNLIEQFANKEIAQIHLIIRGETFKHSSALRFHTKYFASSEEKRLLNEIGEILETGKTDKFWEYAKHILYRKDLQ